MDVINDFKFLLDRESVLKSIDCYSDSDVYEEMCEIYENLKGELEKLAEPKGVFKFDKISEKYKIDEAYDCTHVVLCMLTLGRKVPEKTEEYFRADRYMEGMLFDAMSDSLLMENAKELYKLICSEAKKMGFGLTCKLSPGNADFPIERQKDILEDVDGAKFLDVKVTDGFMLNPVKSVSFVFGADTKLGIPLEDHECSRCTNLKCKMRKEPYKDKKNEAYFNLTVINKENEIHIKAPKQLSIMEILKQNGINVSSPCGGNGTCGKCKVRIISGKTKKMPNNSILGDELFNEGWCLSCSTYLEGDSIICADKSEGNFSILQVYDKSNINVNACYDILDFNLKDKNLGGQSLTSIINSQLNKEYKYTLKALKKLQGVINTNDFKGDKNSLYHKEDFCIIAKEDTILNVCKKDEAKAYGIAIDIGTTTIALSLIDLITGENIQNYSLLNSQKKFGADVITRIQYSNDGNLKEINESIKNDLLKGIKYLCDSTGAAAESIYDIVIAGNTTMLYFLLGISCESLALFPFNTTTTSLLEYKFYEIFDNSFLDCLVTILPGVSAYVGADIVSGLLNCGYNNINKTCILIDIGTNGEMVIGNKSKMLCLATAAGPAFEGANITCGIGSIQGAISQVDINKGEITYKTIGGGEPQGICGSAVIDITAALLKNDIIDETGRFDEDNYSEGFIKISENAKDEDIIFNQKDIREVQLAKSAIRSGIEILIKEYYVSYEDIDTVFLAGGFGYHMNVENAAAIGLIPEELKRKVKCVGNSSLGGAVMYLLDKKSAKNLKSILENINYIDIASNSGFNDLFINNMLF